jgi:hypothetical protein
MGWPGRFSASTFAPRRLGRRLGGVDLSGDLDGGDHPELRLLFGKLDSTKSTPAVAILYLV